MSDELSEPFTYTEDGTPVYQDENGALFDLGGNEYEYSEEDHEYEHTRR
jgi:hypothetical protein